MCIPSSCRCQVWQLLSQHPREHCDSVLDAPSGVGCCSNSGRDYRRAIKPPTDYSPTSPTLPGSNYGLRPYGAASGGGDRWRHRTITSAVSLRRVEVRHVQTRNFHWEPE